MSSIRPAAVAGAFYPAAADELSAQLRALLRGAAATGSEAPKAIIAPHAGYIYSGAIAAAVYARLASLAGRIKHVVLLGPAHRVADHVGSVARDDRPAHDLERRRRVREDRPEPRQRPSVRRHRPRVVDRVEAALVPGPGVAELEHRRPSIAQTAGPRTSPRRVGGRKELRPGPSSATEPCD